MPSCAYAIKSLFKPSFMESLTTITDRIKASIAVKEKIISDGTLIPVIHSVVELITNAFRNGNAVYFCGNGGSAADAQHLAAEFSGRFYKDRKALPSEALHCNTSYLTAVANDYSYDVIYARLIEGIAKKGDVLIGLSTSGNSTNILRAFEKAAELEDKLLERRRNRDKGEVYLTGTGKPLREVITAEQDELFGPEAFNGGKCDEGYCWT